MIKTERTPTGWNWSKLRLKHAPPNPPSSNGANALSRPAHTDSRTNSNPLFETQDMELENPFFQSHLPTIKCIQKHKIPKRDVP
eukprot:863192-Pelagomonas_calceolata.AAC.1